MELFDLSGHITKDGFAALLAEQVDELGRLELTEHLSFCDKCCARYADLLTGDVLLDPPAPIAPGLMARIRRRTRTIMFNRFTKVGLAASLAMGLWITGINYGIIPTLPLAAEDTRGPQTSAYAPAASKFESFSDTQQKNADRMRASLDAVVVDRSDASPTLNMRFSKALEDLISSISNKGDHQK